MTIVATPDPTYSPPRVQVDVAIPSGNVMSDVSVWRVQDGQQILLRSQPVAGFDSRTVYDYECPYGVPVAYGWSADYVAAGTTLFDETWASAGAWGITPSATAAVSGGVVTVQSVTATGQFKRSFTPGRYRISCAGVNLITGPNLKINLIDSLGGFIINRLIVNPGNLFSGTAIDASQPFVIDIGATTFTITGVGGTKTYTFSGGTGLLGTLEFEWTSAPAKFTAGEIKVQNYGTPTSVNETTASVTLASEDAWLVHPGIPSLSVPVSHGDTSELTFTTFAAVGNAANSTLHQILGSKKPIATTTGSRQSDVTSIELRSYSFDQETALVALVDDQTPILIQIPAAWNTGFNCDFYQVGDLDREPVAPTVRYQHRAITLPLTQVQPPIVDVENSGWSWAALAAEFPTWAEVALAFNTWADVLANNRNPGY